MSLDLSYLGITDTDTVHRNLTTSVLYEHAILRGEAKLGKDGPLLANTGKYTGRSPKDKFTGKEGEAADKVWWGDVNKAMTEPQFDKLHQKVLSYFKGRELFVQDVWAGTDPEYRLPVRIINEKAWHNLFARNMFVREGDSAVLKGWDPQFTVLHAPSLHAIPDEDDTNSEAFIVIHFGKRLVLIGGTQYAGEVKKSIFTVMNYMLPNRGVLPMHCSANIGEGGASAIFFGLSGTGKTTLSADPARKLIGDDEHGWSEHGVFNFEGGCYAKVIRLSEEAEPEIYDTTRRFGTVLENVVFDETTRVIDLDDAKYTENTRASYPITHIPNHVPSGRGGNAKNVVMLTADAFGVLPPISKLTPEQAAYHFISGYTAKVAGTERGVKEPQATFSACFGAPFMPMHPAVYAKLLSKKIEDNGAACWLVNTGWTGGAYGVGERMSIKYTRAMLNAALSGKLEHVEYTTHSAFGLMYPKSCPDVPPEILDPRQTWADKDAYDAKAKELAGLFVKNFEQFRSETRDEVINAGPQL
ncbi:MAG: phosphoenolpyruvate carboxykinase [Planctomycetes bacterium]|nr:phosphoenolpyruvate carboxykinase [Planctomycetota bacterium]